MNPSTISYYNILLLMTLKLNAKSIYFTIVLNAMKLKANCMFLSALKCHKVTKNNNQEICSPIIFIFQFS